jgi:hypothetical protein
MTHEEFSVGERGCRGVAVGSIPGSTPSTEVYVPVNGGVYRINVYGEKLDREKRRLLSSVRFEVPSQPVSSLGLPKANAPGTSELAERERAAQDAPEATFEAAALSRETRIAGGCWRADPGFFLQTQHGPRANSAPMTASPRARPSSAGPTTGTRTPTADSGTADALNESGATTSSPSTIPLTAETPSSRPSGAAR